MDNDRGCATLVDRFRNTRLNPRLRRLRGHQALGTETPLRVGRRLPPRPHGCCFRPRRMYPRGAREVRGLRLLGCLGTCQRSCNRGFAPAPLAVLL